jgi:hypothetical protein
MEVTSAAGVPAVAGAAYAILFMAKSSVSRALRKKRDRGGEWLPAIGSLDE